MCKRNLRLERIRVLSILSPPHFLLLSHNIVDLTLNLGHHFLPHLLADEGFGSLDSESLQLAVETLVDLQASGRCVGVISHVESMNNQFDIQIKITAGKAGSRVEILV